MLLDQKNYTCISSQEGSNGLGLKILVAVPPGQVLSEADMLEVQHLGYKLYEELQGRLYRGHPDEIAATKEERVEILRLFRGEAIFVEEIPSGYSQEYGRPWFVVTTRIGRIKIGWRKRVINIDWSETTNKKKAEELFKEEQVTKGDSYDNSFYIHAWGYEKAQEYLDKLFASQTKVF